MTRKKCFLLALALALAGPGCLSPMTHLDEPPPKTPPVQVTAPPPPVVTPDEVTEANAGEKAQALARELDFAANEHAAVPAASAKEITTKP